VDIINVVVHAKRGYFMKHLKYLNYVLKHKWFVLLECWKRGLYWRGLVHDMSKFLPCEWNPYVNYFYGKPEDDITKGRLPGGVYKPEDRGEAFDSAWLHHQKYNKHHWQYWILVKDTDGTRIMKMPKKYMIEMLCDWRGAGRAQGNTGSADWMETKMWYEKNRNNMQLHPATRDHVEFFINEMIGGK